MKNKLKILIIIILLVSLFTVSSVKSDSKPFGEYKYIFKVNQDGVNNITIIYEAWRNGDSWLLLPKNFTKYEIKVLDGEIIHEKLEKAYTSQGDEYVFYSNYTFQYRANGKFMMKITYTMKYGSIIVEPQCFFYSPQIYFKSEDRGVVEIHLPRNIKIGENKIIPPPAGIEEKGEEYVIKINLSQNIARIAIEYTTENPYNPITMRRGIFTVETPRRYRELAERILETYNLFYENLTKIFSVNLTDIQVIFYAPKLEDLWTGGYVPFNGKNLGKIHLNLIYVRTLKGYWEQIALHELVHHFIYAAGITPDLLWFHEGMAEYVSINLTTQIGWRGQLSRKSDLEATAQTLYPNYGFIQDWKPGRKDENIGKYYAAAYAVVKALADENGGLEFYRKFFQEIKDLKNVTTTDILIHYLSKAAGRDLTNEFKEWNFRIIGVENISQIIVEGRNIVKMKGLLGVPWSLIADEILNLAEEALKNGRTNMAMMEAYMGIMIAQYSLTLTTITICIVMLILIRRIKIEELYG